MVPPDPDATPVPAVATPPPTPTPPAPRARPAMPTPTSTPTPTTGVVNLVTCLHCWRYAGLQLPSTDDDYVSTETWLREQFPAVSGPSRHCESCPWQYRSGSELTAALFADVVAIRNVTSSDGRFALMWGLSDNMVRAIDDLLDAGLGDLLVPIGARETATSAGRMLSYPPQDFPRYTPETMVLTTAGFRAAASHMASLPVEATPVPVVATPVPTPGLPTARWNGTPPEFSELPLAFCTAWDVDLPREPFREVVRAAMDAWNTALDIVALTYDGDCPGNTVGERNGINEILRVEYGALGDDIAGEAAAGYAGYARTYEADISISTHPTPSECLAVTMTHELGHALGFAHSGVRGAIMSTGGGGIGSLADVCARYAIQDWEAIRLREIWGLE